MKFIKSFAIAAFAFAALMLSVSTAQATHYNNAVAFSNNYNGYNNAFTYAYPVQQLVQVKAYPVYQAYPVAAPVCAQPIQYQAPTASDICTQTYNQAQFQAPVANHCVAPVAAAPAYQQHVVAVQQAVNYVPVALIANNNHYSGFGYGFNAFRSNVVNHGHRNAVQIVNPYGFKRNNVVAVRNNGRNNNVAVAVRNNGRNNVRVAVNNNGRRNNNVNVAVNNGRFRANNAVKINVQNNGRKNNNAQRIVVRQGLLGQRQVEVRQNNFGQAQRVEIRQGIFGQRRVIINNR